MDKRRVKDFYLLLDTCLCCSYAVTIWLEKFRTNKNFKGILLREDQPEISLIRQRKEFHRIHAGEKKVGVEMIQRLRELYPYIDEAEEAMVKLFGVPDKSISDHPNTFYLGKDINGKSAKKWVKENIEGTHSFIFSHLGQIVKPWLIDATGGHLYNVHSAVLPWARGIYSIENIAARKDVSFFRKCAGFSIHLIDKGVDTGCIMSVYQIGQPFRFESIWELKAYIYEGGYRQYAALANQLVNEQTFIPVSIGSNPGLWGPNYRSKDFTEQQKRLAESGYMEMKLKELEKE